MIGTRFQWDPRKNQFNLAKHGIAFEDAIAVFDDPYELTEPGHSVSGEARQQIIGSIEGLATLLVVFVERWDAEGSIFRIISARPASRIERSRYERRKP